MNMGYNANTGKTRCKTLVEVPMGYTCLVVLESGSMQVYTQRGGYVEYAEPIDYIEYTPCQEPIDDLPLHDGKLFSEPTIGLFNKRYRGIRVT